MQYRLPLAQFRYQVSLQKQQIFLHQPVNQQWYSLTWDQVDDKARRIATGLLAQGFQPGDRIGILSKNCAEWLISDLAIMMAGMISVPIYATAGEKTIKYVIDHSGMKAMFIGYLESSDAAERGANSVFRIGYAGANSPVDDSWDKWLEKYSPISLDKIPDNKADDIMTLVYTSGSTGNPKGVSLSFDNLGSAAYATANLFETNSDDRVVSYLPLAHITERSAIAWMSIYSGVNVYFVESLKTFPNDLTYARPTAFVSVPRLWAKFQAAVLADIPDEKLQRLLKIPVISWWVKRKIKKSLGFDSCKFFASGSAPIAPDILRWFQAIDIEISEAWGMTETSGVSCHTVPFCNEAVGTIGRPSTCVEIKLSAEGEILIRGDAVFKSYHNNLEATAESFIDGWFKTGDCAELNESGYYQIIGRIKEQFKTAKGKYVAPVPIEIMLAGNSDVEQVCVLGSGRKQPLAVVVLSEQFKQRTEPVHERLMKTLSDINAALEGHQKLDHLIVCEEFWTIENELLTPTLKIKRNELEQRFSSYLHRDFSQPVVWEAEMDAAV